MNNKSELFSKLDKNFEKTLEVILKDTPSENDKIRYMKRIYESLESIRNEHEGVEYWNAKDLKELFGYKKWENFFKVINKGAEACKNSEVDTLKHFQFVTKTIGIGSSSKESIIDVHLTRYACYLVAQNGDPRKSEISFAQTYFAEQTRRFELILERIEINERLGAREKLKETENLLSKVVHERGFKGSDFGLMRSKGDEALFNGLSTMQMKKKLGVPDKRSLADYLDTVLLKGKDFAASMTTHNIEVHEISGVKKITNEHVINNEAVRNTLVGRNIIPENLPAKEDIKKIERRIKADEKLLTKIKPNNIKESYVNKESKEYEINISKDLWKIALLIMISKPAGIIYTTELIEEIPNYIIIPEKYQQISESKKEPKYIQVIRNLKSNRKNKSNFINQGYVTDIKGGYQITKKGLDFVKKEFKDFI